MLCIQFTSVADVNIRHLLIVPSQTVTSLYAMMIQDEPADTASDEHVEGMQEITNQLLGQIQNQSDGGINFDQLEIKLVDLDDEMMSFASEYDGLSTEYTISNESNNHSIVHFIWTESNIEDELELKEEEFSNEPVTVQRAEFDSFKPTQVEEKSSRNIEMLLDVEMQVIAELGKKSMFIKDVLKLGKGSIVELDKAAGEPLEVFVNGKKLAEGEVVVVDDHFGIRITQLIGPKERILSLG